MAGNNKSNNSRRARNEAKVKAQRQKEQQEQLQKKNQKKNEMTIKQLRDKIEKKLVSGLYKTFGKHFENVATLFVVIAIVLGLIGGGVALYKVFVPIIKPQTPSVTYTEEMKQKDENISKLIIMYNDLITENDSLKAEFDVVTKELEEEIAKADASDARIEQLLEKIELLEAELQKEKGKE